jgi:hypothetical protein
MRFLVLLIATLLLTACGGSTKNDSDMSDTGGDETGGTSSGGANTGGKPETGGTTGDAGSAGSDSGGANTGGKPETGGTTGDAGSAGSPSGDDSGSAGNSGAAGSYSGTGGSSDSGGANTGGNPETGGNAGSPTNEGQTTLRVELSLDTPSAATIAYQQGAHDLFYFRFTAEGGGVYVNTTTVTRGGVGSASDWQSVFLMSETPGVLAQGTINASSNTSEHDVQVYIPEGETLVLHYGGRLEPEASADNQHFFYIASAADISSDADEVVGEFPVSGNILTIIDVPTVTITQTGPEAYTGTHRLDEFNLLEYELASVVDLTARNTTVRIEIRNSSGNPPLLPNSADLFAGSTWIQNSGGQVLAAPVSATSLTQDTVDNILFTEIAFTEDYDVPSGNLSLAVVNDLGYQFPAGYEIRAGVSYTGSAPSVTSFHNDAANQYLPSGEVDGAVGEFLFGPWIGVEHSFQSYPVLESLVVTTADIVEGAPETLYRLNVIAQEGDVALGRVTFQMVHNFSGSCGDFAVIRVDTGATSYLTDATLNPTYTARSGGGEDILLLISFAQPEVIFAEQSVEYRLQAVCTGIGEGGFITTVPMPSSMSAFTDAACLVGSCGYEGNWFTDFDDFRTNTEAGNQRIMWSDSFEGGMFQSTVDWFAGLPSESGDWPDEVTRTHN